MHATALLPRRRIAVIGPACVGNGADDLALVPHPPFP